MHEEIVASVGHTNNVHAALIVDSGPLRQFGGRQDVKNEERIRCGRGPLRQSIGAREQHADVAARRRCSGAVEHCGTRRGRC